MCRSRLSYEQFAAFLANIKELNAHRQSQVVTFSFQLEPLFCFFRSFRSLELYICVVVMQETLEKADQIFGAENKDLFVSFQGLLSRSLT
jgi:hypothetical protein